MRLIMKSDELKLCPFCGGKAKLMACDGTGEYFANVGTTKLKGRELDHLLIRCEKCGIRTKAYSTEKGVFKAWNKRAEVTE